MGKFLWYARIKRDECVVEYYFHADTKEEAMQYIYKVTGERIKVTKK